MVYLVNPKDLDDYGDDLYENLGKLQNSKTQNEYDQLACELWGKLKLDDQLIKNNSNKTRIKTCLIKAVLIKAIKHSFIVILKNQNEDSIKNATFHDLALIMFDLLENQYYLGRESDTAFISYHKRSKLYLLKNIYAESKLTSHNASQWRRRIRSTIADYLSKQDDAKKYLKKAISEYIACDAYGKHRLILQKPCLTPENFPSRDQYNLPKPETVCKMPVRADFYFEGIPKPVSWHAQQSEKVQNQTSSFIQNDELYSSDESTNMPPALGAPVEPHTQKVTEGLSFIKSDNRLISKIGYKKIKNKANYILRNCLQPVYIALSMITSCFNPSCRPLHQHDWFNIGTNQASYTVENSDFTVETTVRTGWNRDTELKIGDRVEFQIVYKNTSDARQENVIIDDQLPANLRYVPGSTWLLNGNFPKGTDILEDDVVKTGLLIGNYTPGSNAIIRFYADVVDDNFTCGKFILRNWGRSSVGGKVIQDSADVNVQLASCPDPENDIEV